MKRTIIYTFALIVYAATVLTPIALKLFGILDWAWLGTLSPLWLGTIVLPVILLMMTLSVAKFEFGIPSLAVPLVTLFLMAVTLVALSAAPLIISVVTAASVFIAADSRAGIRNEKREADILGAVPPDDNPYNE